MGVKKKIDWDRIDVVIEVADEPNPNNPYVEVDQAHRDQALRELARTVLLRKVNGASTSN